MRWTLPSPFDPPIARGLAGAFAVFAAVFGMAAPVHAAAPNFRGSSADGKIVFFDTEEQLIEGDTDSRRDVYERSYDETVGAYVTREISLGPTGGNNSYAAQFEGANEDGTRVFFSTEERMVAEDTDLRTDVYMRNLEEGTTLLVSKGEAACLPGCGSGANDVTFAEATADGTEVFFETKEKLGSGDTDASTDLYLRSLEGSGQTTLVSVGEAACSPGCGNGSFEVSRRGISSDGRYAYFATAEKLTSADSDGSDDIYARDVQASATYLVSQGQCAGCGSGGAVPIFAGASAAGTRVFFSSEEKLSSADTDPATDIYARDLPGGPTTLISGGSVDVTASFAVASADGTHVFFTTAEGLLAGDDDEVNDVYEWTDGSGLSLVTSAPCLSRCGATFEAASADSTKVLFTTAADLLPADQDEAVDIYRQTVGGGELVLASRGEPGCLSCWNGPFDARFNEASADASRVVFTTAEGVLVGDDDEEDDIYARDIGSGTSSLITIAPSYCPLKKGHCGATSVGSSENGLHVFFSTVERFTLDDGDKEVDVYERFLGSGPSEEVTRLVSQGNDPNLNLGPESPTLTGTTPGSPAATTSPRVLGEAADSSSIKLYTSEDCSGEPAATGTAAELLSPGLGVTVSPGSLTKFRATAEAEGFVSACSQPVSYQQLSSTGGGGGSEVEDVVENSEGNFIPQPGVVALATDPRPALSDLTPPTRVTFAPAGKTRSRNPTFRFVDATGQAGTTFRCKVDRKPWKACASPLRLKHLRRGRHVLEIQAINGAGTPEPAPAKRSFRVVPR
jgi:hypothetical protein